MASIDPDFVIGEQTWTDLEQVIVPGILYTLQVIEPVTFSLIGFEDADLLATIKTIARIRNLLISVVTTSTSDSRDGLRTAVEDAITIAINTGDDALIDLLNEVRFPLSRKIGVNGALGAEAVAELGVGLEIRGEIKASLFLLLLDLDVYNGTQGTLLLGASMPADFSLDAGASAGEGVEVTVDAGGAMSFNLFDLTVRHWDAELPAAALMEVAGFTVLEFDGFTRQDGSFAGSGFLMLPMGGIVKAVFEVDEAGSVISGSREGGFDLGPLGNFPFLGGELDDDGLHGSVNIGLLGSDFDADFILMSSGLLTGTYDGDLTIAGQQLAAVNIFLDDDGQFSGRYQGDVRVGGFAANSDLALNNNGFKGSSSLMIFGSELLASDLEIGRTGRIRGRFTGNLVIGAHTLSEVVLRVVKGGLIGTAVMDLPGRAGALVEVRILNDKVSAFYQGSLFDGLVTQASFELASAGINMHANFDLSSLPGLSAEILDLLLDAAAIAADQLQQAQQDLAAAQLVVTDLEAEIEVIGAQLTADLEAAQQAVVEKTRDAQQALEALNTVDAQIAALNQQYNLLLNDARLLVDARQAEFNHADSQVRSYTSQINSLDNWYNNLSAFNRTKQLAYYTSRRVTLVALRASARTARTNAQVALDAAQFSLDILSSELANQLNPLNVSRAALLLTYAAASDALIDAEATLAAINAEIASDAILTPLYVALNAAQLSLDGAQRSLNILQGAIALADYFATAGAAGAFTLLSASIGVNLDVAMAGRGFELDASVIYLGQRGLIRVEFDATDPATGFRQAVEELQSGASQLISGDSIAPTILGQNVGNWMAGESLVKLVASDDPGGTGVASITLWASGAQVIGQKSIAGGEAYVLFDTEGETSLHFFATDLIGNDGDIQSLSINVDTSGPRVTVDPNGVMSGAYEVSIRATDISGSGIDYLAVSARGAEYFSEVLSFSDETTIQLTRAGETELTITSVDIAGNITTLARNIMVPEISVDDDTNSGNQGDDKADRKRGGTSVELIWLLGLLSLWFFSCRPLVVFRRRAVESEGHNYQTPAG